MPTHPNHYKPQSREIQVISTYYNKNRCPDFSTAPAFYCFIQPFCIFITLFLFSLLTNSYCKCMMCDIRMKSSTNVCGCTRASVRTSHTFRHEKAAICNLLQMCGFRMAVGLRKLHRNKAIRDINLYKQYVHNKEAHYERESYFSLLRWS